MRFTLGCISSLLTFLQKKIKRKEYPQLQDFINDVELVFTNATNFNEAGSQIYEDAVLLRVRTLWVSFLEFELTC